MLRLTTDQPDFWDYLLPEEARRMHPELVVVDAVLDDPRFLAPFLGRFSARRGRYTIPMETYLRMMYMKTKYQLGYESLVAEVTDSVSWRRFCRISLSGRVPEASTLTKLTNGPCHGLADEVHDALVRELARKKVLRLRGGRPFRTRSERVNLIMRDVNPRGGAGAGDGFFGLLIWFRPGCLRS